MGDFFYYGQKDTIRRLNELAGRGAVVASYAPKVGMSPLGGPNGLMDPAWLDPALPISTTERLCSGATAKYGYNFVLGGHELKWYKIAVFAPSDDQGNLASLLINGVLNDEWSALKTSTISLRLGTRNGLTVEWHLEGGRRNNSRFIVYKMADESYQVCAFLTAYAAISFNLQGVACETFAVPAERLYSPPGGTMVFDTSQPPGTQGYFPPRWQGWADAPQGTLFNELIAVGDGSIMTSYLGGGSPFLVPGQERESLRIGIGGIPGNAYAGALSWRTSAGNGSLYKEGYKLTLKAYDQGSLTWGGALLSVGGDGKVFMPTIKVGCSDTSPMNVISVAGVQGTDILTVIDAAGFRKCDGGWGNLTNAAMLVAANTVTGRSSNNRGTVNTTGNDYAEYIVKSGSCGTVAPGQIIGINMENNVTDIWADAVMFSIKSTAPSFVGGDSWADSLGAKPTPLAGQVPAAPLRREGIVTQQGVPGSDPVEYIDVVTVPGDTDDEWTEKQNLYAAALMTYATAVGLDADAMSAFDVALEAERQKVDRIAIAGRVPVNVLGAQPGDYIVAVPDGAGIKGIAVREDDLTERQYRKAVGRVISIEPDGRAYVMVKAV